MISGRTDLYAALGAWIIPAASLVAVITDLRRGRIPNWLTAPVFLAGAAAAFLLGGRAAGGDALLGAGAGLLLLGWMFWLGHIGGGDVKLLMGLGAWGGLRYTVEVALLSVLLGGLLAAVILAAKGLLPALYGKLHLFVAGLTVPGMRAAPLSVDRTQTMPFGVPLAAAAVWTLFGHPLSALVGGGPW